MRELFVGPFKSVVRIWAQVRKELIQVRRRPGAFFSLVLGPFLIMAVFGLGYTGTRRALDTAIVIPADVGLPSDPGYYQSLAGPAINVVEVSATSQQPMADLAAQKLDMVVVAPTNAVQTFESGQQSTIQVSINEVDPVAAGYAGFIATVLNQKINEEIIKEAATGGQVEQTINVPPEVVAAPTVVNLSNVAPSAPSIVGFAAPAALALMLQHMAVTLTALSFIRERLSGAMELFRVSPTNSLELVLGKYLGLGIVSAIVAAISGVLLVTVLGVPLLGSPWLVAGVIALLVFASLGIGLVISIISDSERQAVQLALLLLLASVFFSGFVLPVNEFHEGVQYLAYLLPVTHGIRLLQDLMLRGDTTAWWQLGSLAGLGIVFLLLSVILLRRQMRRA
ncbi:MAG TPA: ABC transporter permease [Candidatus Limnocylindrales bacterium]|jgi:ABC-2 type transport system permease protein